jgi:hypothetical protein
MNELQDAASKFNVVSGIVAIFFELYIINFLLAQRSKKDNEHK